MYHFSKCAHIYHSSKIHPYISLVTHWVMCIEYLDIIAAPICEQVVNLGTLCAAELSTRTWNTTLAPCLRNWTIESPMEFYSSTHYPAYRGSDNLSKLYLHTALLDVLQAFQKILQSHPDIQGLLIIISWKSDSESVEDLIGKRVQPGLVFRTIFSP